MCVCVCEVVLRSYRSDYARAQTLIRDSWESAGNLPCVLVVGMPHVVTLCVYTVHTAQGGGGINLKLDTRLSSGVGKSGSVD